MGALVTGGAFLGAILGRSFKVLSLIPASVLAIAVLLLRRDLAWQTGLHFSMEFAVLIVSLELGYVAALVSSDLPAVVRRLSKILARPGAPGNRCGQA
jgi:hypothetical protein